MSVISSLFTKPEKCLSKQLYNKSADKRDISALTDTIFEFLSNLRTRYCCVLLPHTIIAVSHSNARKHKLHRNSSLNAMSTLLEVVPHAAPPV